MPVTDQDFLALKTDIHNQISEAVAENAWIETDGGDAVECWGSQCRTPEWTAASLNSFTEEVVLDSNAGLFAEVCEELKSMSGATEVEGHSISWSAEFRRVTHNGKYAEYRVSEE